MTSLSSNQELSYQRSGWLVLMRCANSAVRQQAGIGITAWDYRQHCMLINVRLEQPQQDITWQQFYQVVLTFIFAIVFSNLWRSKSGRGRWFGMTRHLVLSNFLRWAQINYVMKLSLASLKNWVMWVLNSGSFPLTRRVTSILEK